MRMFSSNNIKLKIKRKTTDENVKQKQPHVTKHKTKEKRKKEYEKKKLKKKLLKEKKLLGEFKMPEKSKRKSTEESLLIEPDKQLNTNSKNAEKDDCKGRYYTLSIALPGSILDNAQSFPLRTYLAGQVARAAVIFNVDEIIIFDETKRSNKAVSDGSKGNTNNQFGRILQYMECPQYIRKNFFPKHSDLQYAGLLNPLGCPHHMSVDEESIYREGVVLRPFKSGEGSLVKVGLKRDVVVDQTVPSGKRITVKLDALHTKQQNLKGKVVSFSTPRIESGIYWGYTVRMADSLSSVITECPYEEGYDTIIGTSDKGSSVDELKLGKFRHGLIVFGGLKGLEASLEADDKLTVDDPKYLFEYYLNTCPHQGSRTIRTEEAILITMSALRPKIDVAQR